ncbi:MAG TPA: hypothetical protein VMH77_08035 [Steroidobacteraceae bacterium]|nr:hypothetical protein [Steroidobacteraceae bacterium]
MKPRITTALIAALVVPLLALAAHDPSRLPLAPDVKYTETGIVKRIGEGLWKTAQSLPRYRLPGDSRIVGYQQEDLTTPSRLWTRSIPVPERNSRYELLVAADAYFRGFETNGTSDYIPAPLALRPTCAGTASSTTTQRQLHAFHLSA